LRGPRNLIDGSQSPSAQPISTCRGKNNQKRTEQQDHPFESIQRFIKIIHRCRELDLVFVFARTHLPNPNTLAHSPQLLQLSGVKRFLSWRTFVDLY